MIALEAQAAAEVETFQRARALCSDQGRFTEAFRASMESLANPLASAILEELGRREAAPEPGRTRHLDRLNRAFRLLYGTDDLDKLPPMAREQVAKVHRSWNDPVKASRLIAVDRLSHPEN